MSGAVALPSKLAWRRPNFEAITPWILPVLVLALWQLGCDQGWITKRVLPSPVSVLRAGVDLAWSGELGHHVAISCRRAFLGFLIGGSLGFALGVLNGLSRSSERLLDSSVQMLRNVPHLAIIPLVILWFGIDEAAKLFLVSVGVFFPIYLNTHHGVRQIDPGLLEMARIYRLRGLALFRRVVLPGAMPSVLLGVRYALGIMWLTLIVAETISASSGIGYMTMNAREFLQTDVVLLGVLMYALLGKLADTSARVLERRCLAWHPNFQRKSES
jgi:sulfonate transport system permease protein